MCVGIYTLSLSKSITECINTTDRADFRRPA